MATLSVTIGDVIVVTSASANGNGTAFEAIDAGEMVRFSSSDNLIHLADATTTDDATITDGGMALCTAAAGQPVTYAKTGSVITIASGTLVTGTAYYLSGTAGKLEEFSDLSSGEFITLCGLAISTSNIKLVVDSLGVAKA